MSQSNLNLPTKAGDPVGCLGQTFASEEARREHFLKLLAQKLKDPEFRKVEGFPIGKDEDILALSDPPYYTACPNPWIGDFIKQYGTSYDPKKSYHREPFTADVSEGRTHAIYTAHAYHTKVPHRAIMRYILHYTQPGDFVFDGFAGTGMTGVAAQFCGDKAEVQELGYRITEDGTVRESNRQQRGMPGGICQGSDPTLRFDGMLGLYVLGISDQNQAVRLGSLSAVKRAVSHSQLVGIVGIPHDAADVPLSQRAKNQSSTALPAATASAPLQERWWRR